MEKKEDLGGIEGTYKEEEGPIEKWKDRGRREEGKVRRKSKERGETILLNTKAYLDRRLLHLGPREKVFWSTRILKYWYCIPLVAVSFKPAIRASRIIQRGRGTEKTVRQ